ncbi:GNAT family N-acetyltransferase [Roseobacter weihaiensis]|uniref:GNAT family N-acetyltransferase n=1 Tax=Roseobacter weihaiensis TaxID=2763262 RepID=UPI001D0BA992|nr:GNAT family N-acetyltransferase [Roseobacter sp. H9]
MPTPKTIAIRRLVPSEGAAYRQIRLEALKTAPDAFGSSYEAEAARDLSHFEERVASGCVFGAFDRGRIIGMVGFYQQSGAKQNHKGVLWGMYVAPGYRKSGAGRRLVRAVVSHATDLVDLVTLSVMTENQPAIALYSEMGFRTYGTEPRALKSATGYLDEALMIRDLN